MKVKVNFPTKIEIGNKTFEGDMEFEKPTMKLVFEAGNFCSVRNEIGFNMAMAAGFLDIPLNQLKELDPDTYTELFIPINDILPKL